MDVCILDQQGTKLVHRRRCHLARKRAKLLAHIKRIMLSWIMASLLVVKRS
jgi:hypothetical protein